MQLGGFAPVPPRGRGVGVPRSAPNDAAGTYDSRGISARTNTGGTTTLKIATEPGRPTLFVSLDHQRRRISVTRHHDDGTVTRVRVDPTEARDLCDAIHDLCDAYEAAQR